MSQKGVPNRYYVLIKKILVGMRITLYTSGPTLIIINYTNEIFTEINLKIFRADFIKNALISSVLKLEKC